MPKEIKADRADKAEQLPPAAQQELSLRGDRTRFLEFHRYMYAMKNADINRLMKAMKQFVINNKLSEDDSVYCDQKLTEDAIHYHTCLRSEKDFAPAICDEIAKSFVNNVQLAGNHHEITSEHLIFFVENLFEKYSKNP